MKPGQQGELGLVAEAARVSVAVHVSSVAGVEVVSSSVSSWRSVYAVENGRAMVFEEGACAEDVLPVGVCSAAMCACKFGQCRLEG